MRLKPEDTKVYSIASEKGGVGKTATAINLAVGLGKLGKKVAVIDIDAQGHVGRSFGIDKKGLKLTMVDVLIGRADMEEIKLKTPYGVEIFPSRKDLSSLDDIVRNPENALAFPDKTILLKEAIDEIRNKYQYIIIDCPPAYNLYTINAYVASDGVIIPVVPEGLPVDGLTEVLENVNNVKSSGRNNRLEVLGILKTMVKHTTLHISFGDQLNQFCLNNNIRVFEATIPNVIGFAEAQTLGKPALIYDPKNPKLQGYMKLAKEVINIG